MSAILQLKGVTRRYSGLVAVSDVSFEMVLARPPPLE